MSLTRYREGESAVLFKPADRSPNTYEHQFYMHKGARLVFTLYVESIDPSTTVRLEVDTTYTKESPFINILNTETDAIGPVSRIVGDFHCFMRAKVIVTGGNARFSVGMSVFDNASQTRIENAELEVNLNRKTQPNKTHDSVRVGNELYEMAILPDGSIKANIVNTSVEPEVIVPQFNEIGGLLKNVVATIDSRTAPIGKTTYLQRITAGGDVVAIYTLEVNGSPIMKKRSYFGGSLDVVFDLDAYSENGYELNEGDVVRVRVQHKRNFTSTHHSTIQVLEIG